jgi:hypothetical protein
MAGGEQCGVHVLLVLAQLTGCGEYGDTKFLHGDNPRCHSRRRSLTFWARLRRNRRCLHDQEPLNLYGDLFFSPGATTNRSYSLLTTQSDHYNNTNSRSIMELTKLSQLCLVKFYHEFTINAFKCYILKPITLDINSGMYNRSSPVVITGAVERDVHWTIKPV